MTITQVKGRAEGMPRAGTFALSLLADPLDVCVLRALRPGPKALADLRRAVGSPPQTTMRGHLRTLTKVGALAKRRQNEFPGNLDYELTDAGHSLLTVAGVLEAWLADSPDGALALGSAAAKSAVRALMQGWSTTLVRALVARPLTLTELDRIINLSYPSLERRLVAMRLAGQITTTSGRGRGTPYTVTAWLRHAIAPLGAAARWERANDAPGASPIGRLDVEAAFLLAMPLIRLAPGLRGACRLTVEIPGRSESRQAGVLVVVEDGRVVSCIARLQGHADAWASGSVPAWFQAVVEQEHDPLEIGGKGELVTALIDRLHEALFTVGIPHSP